MPKGKEGRKDGRGRGGKGREGKSLIDSSSGHRSTSHTVRQSSFFYTWREVRCCHETRGFCKCRLLPPPPRFGAAEWKNSSSIGVGVGGDGRERPASSRPGPARIRTAASPGLSLAATGPRRALRLLPQEKAQKLKSLILPRPFIRSGVEGCPCSAGCLRFQTASPGSVQSRASAPEPQISLCPAIARLPLAAQRPVSLLLPAAPEDSPGAQPRCLPRGAAGSCGSPARLSTEQPRLCPVPPLGSPAQSRGQVQGPGAAG